jgi:PPOX class probable F420-dependent enzyme
VSLDEAQREFLERQRVLRLATVDGAGQPYLVPICFALDGDTLYSAIDEKPKQAGAGGLRRLRNLADNPRVAILADHYEEDWTRLAFFLLLGRARVLVDGPRHARALLLLRARYPQYATMDLESRPVIAVSIERATGWGDLDAEDSGP